MTPYNDSSDFQRGMMQNDTCSYPENALTAVVPEETRRDPAALAASSVATEVGSDQTAAVVNSDLNIVLKNTHKGDLYNGHSFIDASYRWFCMLACVLFGEW